MPAPTQDNIRKSLQKLEKGSLLAQKDIFNIAWGFTFHPTQEPLLLKINTLNNSLAETLLVFSRRLRQAETDPTNLTALIGLVFLHYVINTNGPILEADGEDPFDVFDAAKRYAETLCMDLRKGKKGRAILQFNKKKLEFSEWDTLHSSSAAASLRQFGTVINRARYGLKDVIPSHAFGFNEAHEWHSLPNAMTLADASMLAYFEPAYVQKQLKHWGYNTFRWIERKDSDTQCFIAGKDGHLIVSFRGTSSGADALVDLSFLKTAAFGGRGRVHQGFNYALDSVWKKVHAAVNELGAKQKLFICGHSLGASLAQLAAHRFALGGYQIAGVYVYGSPRVGNREFVEAYNELLGDLTFLHINDQDIVTQVPPELFGFHHLGGAPFVFNEGHLISRPEQIASKDTKEIPLENIDTSIKDEIHAQAETSMRAATHFLSKPIHGEMARSYEASFESGAVDDHSQQQYLFKFACAILDSEWRRISAE